ncbi:SDR family oxidoreductase [Tenacibaculum sp. IB213877]|uniref:SDR family oxidoreductase n=1 Tax=Tenacibaculum sp. IB213877 TaxID=3097351 RepID=UPI002A5B06D5|nr:SDR family oxidoreductase [Tenacibaculum sp. IB213877]MDY0781421.1 SDR family oxidoreductase [Tenacibaculum sp. IB213877]
MKILITGTTGYIAKRLIIKLHEEKHELTCCVRDLNRIPDEIQSLGNIAFLKVDFLNTSNIQFPKDIDVAYYLIHSMTSSKGNFEAKEIQCAYNFKALVEKTTCQQVIYLSGIVNDNILSTHLRSRLNVEKTLASKKYALTTFRAGIIVGSGSSSFEIIRDIVEKLPIMVAPKWLNTKTQPIAIRDVISFLTNALLKENLYNKYYDIVGPEVLTYKQMLLQFAEVRNLKRHIITLPILSPRLSSYWLYFVTSTTFKLAQTLVDSLKVEVIGKKSNINYILNIEPISYKEAVSLAFQKIEQSEVISSWKDAISSGVFKDQLSKHIQLPQFGCYKDVRFREVNDLNYTLTKIWSIGGENGWYKFNWLWKIRGIIDKVFGGVGLRRGRTHSNYLEAGDPLDFWRVLYANKTEMRLLLFAEMKLPGEAWLEFKIVKNRLYQRAVFRPKGLLGRMYWYTVFPFHGFVFSGLINELTKK